MGFSVTLISFSKQIVNIRTRPKTVLVSAAALGILWRERNHGIAFLDNCTKVDLDVFFGISELADFDVNANLNTGNSAL